MTVSRPGATVDVTLVLPVPRRADAVGLCVTQAIDAMKKGGLDGEVVVVDNGSTDGSAEVATAAGARVIHEQRRGYGRALRTGFEQARGEVVVMADADGTYDLAADPRDHPAGAGGRDGPPPRDPARRGDERDDAVPAPVPRHPGDHVPDVPRRRPEADQGQPDRVPGLPPGPDARPGSRRHRHGAGVGDADQVGAGGPSHRQHRRRLQPPDRGVEARHLVGRMAPPEADPPAGTGHHPDRSGSDARGPRSAGAAHRLHPALRDSRSARPGGSPCSSRASPS